MQSLTLGLGVGLSCVSGSRYLLNYDFTKGFPAALTHTRASNATYINSSGSVATASSNVPRITHDKDGNALGYLHEPQVTNHVLSSLDAFGTGTVKVGGAAVTDTGSVVSPSGATDAKEVTVSGANYLRHNVTLVAETAYVWSFWAKKGTATTLKTSVYNISGAAEISGVGLYDYTSQVSTDEWTRIEIPFTTPAGCTSVGVYSTRGSSNGTFFIWGAQVEEGTAATSLIPTTGAQATRQADAVADYVVAGLSAVDSFTMLMKYSPLSDARQDLFGITDGGSDSIKWDSQRNVSLHYVVDRGDAIGGTSDYDVSRSADVANMRVAFSYSSSLREADINGGGATKTSSKSMSTSTARGLDRLNFGSTATNIIAKSVRLFGKSKTAAELATLTT